MNRVLIFLVTLIWVASSFGQDLTERSIGRATNKDGQLVYIEKHTSTFRKGELQRLETEYFSKEGKKFGFISSDFSTSHYVPNYSFKDNRHQRGAGVEWIDNYVKAYAKTRSKKEAKKFLVNDKMVAGQGLHNFIRKNLQKFIDDPALKHTIDFLIPMNQDTYSFHIRARKIEKEKGLVQLRIEAENWFVRLLAPYIDVTYSLQSNRLMKFVGPSNLLDNSGDSMDVTIEYSYPEKSYAATQGY